MTSLNTKRTIFAVLLLALVGVLFYSMSTLPKAHAQDLDVDVDVDDDDDDDETASEQFVENVDVGDEDDDDVDVDGDLDVDVDDDDDDIDVDVDEDDDDRDVTFPYAESIGDDEDCDCDDDDVSLGFRCCAGSCYNPNSFNCLGGVLCLKGRELCGNVCYEPAALQCFNNRYLCGESNICGDNACYDTLGFECRTDLALPDEQQQCQEGELRCGEECFDPTEFSCANGTLVAVQPEETAIILRNLNGRFVNIATSRSMFLSTADNFVFGYSPSANNDENGALVFRGHLKRGAQGVLITGLYARVPEGDSDVAFDEDDQGINNPELGMVVARFLGDRIRILQDPLGNFGRTYEKRNIE